MIYSPELSEAMERMHQDDMSMLRAALKGLRAIKPIVKSNAQIAVASHKIGHVLSEIRAYGTGQLRIQHAWKE